MIPSPCADIRRDGAGGSRRGDALPELIPAAIHGSPGSADPRQPSAPSLGSFYERHFGAMWAATMLVGVAYAHANRFVQDDAFISFRYARNLALGRGLVWNHGERVEGYTNFLWTVAVAGAIRLGIDPVVFTQWAGIPLLLGSLFFTYRLGEIVASRHVGLFAAFVAATHYSFSCFATGGLETPLHTCLVTGAIYLSAAICRASSPRLLVTASIVAALAVLTRIDAVVLLAAPSLALAHRLRQRAGSIRAAALLVGPFTCIVATWLLWKHSYYGAFLPQTFYTKLASGTSAWRGLAYVAQFAASCLWLPLPLVYAVKLARHRVPPGAWADEIHLLGSILAWIAYIIAAGGDFIEYRLLVPIIPLVSIQIARLVRWYDGSRAMQAAIVAIILGGALVNVGLARRNATLALPLHTGREVSGVESVVQLRDNLAPRGKNWIAIGRSLGDAFEPGSSVLIATSAAGAIPYYSDLATVDMLGLNDPRVQREGHHLGTRPGHTRIASMRYMLDRGVNLVLGHPWSDCSEPTRQSYSRAELATLFFGERLPDIDHVPPSASVIAVPIQGGCPVVGLYLIPHPDVAAAIERGGWRTHPIGTHEAGRPEHVLPEVALRKW